MARATATHAFVQLRIVHHGQPDGLDVECVLMLDEHFAGEDSAVSRERMRGTNTALQAALTVAHARVWHAIDDWAHERRQ
jgi:hypothetical protein